MMDDPCEYMNKIKMAMDKDNLALAAQTAQEVLQEQTNVPLAIGITGVSGSGKSSLVNALRGIEDDDEGAAPTGVVETTTEPTEYSHPSHPLIKIWDLPGIGTPNFKADEYLKNVGFEKFDFSIIVSATRFSENDTKLALEITKMKKKFYYVRSKIDENIRAEKRKKQFDENNTLKQIKDNCTEELHKLMESPQVFLVSSHELHLYDFQALCNTFEKELPEHKRDVLLLALPNISQKMIDKKKNVLNSRIKYLALVSAAGATVLVPGVSCGIDLTLTLTFIKDCQASLGVNHSSLQHLANVAQKPLQDLKDQLKSPLAGVIITKELLVQVVSMSVAYLAATAVEEGARYIPLLGIPLASSLSFITTYKTLQYLLGTLADDAQTVFSSALGLDTSV